tara:strand:+ start:246 stop:794 length:549 start_codon:yes stop_codon:yes gene_type:complete
MIIKVRTNNIGFDVVPEHRSTTILNWIYYLENDEVASIDKFDLHWLYMTQTEPESWSGDVFYMDRDVIERFRDGFASYAIRHLDSIPTISKFLENIDTYETSDKENFDLYLDKLTLGSYAKVYNYDEIEDLRTMLETRYGKTIDASIRDMHTDVHGDGEIFQTTRNKFISNANLSVITARYS